MLLNMNLPVLEEFMGDYSARLTGSYIAKKKRLNQKTTASYLAVLEKEGFLKSEASGRNKNYFLNLDNKEVIRNYILAVEHLRTIDFYKKNLVIKEIAEKIEKYIKGSALIFGSYAKGLQKKGSDLDILVLGSCKEEEILKIGELYKIEINMKIYRKFEKDTLTMEAIRSHIFIKNFDEIVLEVLNAFN